MRDGRLAELDVLRGFAVAVMILVVSPGSWAHTYPWLQHADWNGWTFADLVFPDFLFGVGMALGLTFGRSLDPVGDAPGVRRKVGRRVAGLIALGLALNFLGVVANWLGAASVGPGETVEWRLPGVLQRIALCYLIAVLIVSAPLLSPRDDKHRFDRRATIAALVGTVCLLGGYWALLAFVGAPGSEAGDLTKAGSLPAYVDRAVFTPRHMWQLGAESWRGPIVYDPEGLLSTLPATANVLFGFLAIAVWRGFPKSRTMLLFAAGTGLLALGLLLDAAFPINKKLWTSSFALLTSGISFLALLGVGLVMRRPVAERALYPLTVLGGNALLAFSLSAVLSAFGSIPLLAGMTAQEWAFRVVGIGIGDPFVASFACALCVLAAIVLAILPLHRRGMHLRL